MAVLIVLKALTLVCRNVSNMSMIMEKYILYIYLISSDCIKLFIHVGKHTHHYRHILYNYLY